MPISVRITLDSGVLLEDDEHGTSFGSFKVGLSKPRIHIYVDGKMVQFNIDETAIDSQIELRTSGDQNRKDAGAVTVSDDLLKYHLLRLPELYDMDETFVPISLAAFNCILTFFSGRVSSSTTKDYDFVEMDVNTRQPTGRRKTLNAIAQNLLIYLDLSDGETFELLSGEQILWSSAQHSIDKSLHIEIVNDSAAADVFLHDRLNLPEGQNYWLPDSGASPPLSPYTGQNRRRIALQKRELMALERAMLLSHIPHSVSIRLLELVSGPLPPQSEPVSRFINLWFSSQASDEPLIPAHQALTPNEDIYLRVNIGPYDFRTILEEANPFPRQDEIERAFPETRGKAIPLEISLFSTDFEIEAKQQKRRVILARDRSTRERVFQGNSSQSWPRQLTRVCLLQESSSAGIDGYRNSRRSQKLY